MGGVRGDEDVDEGEGATGGSRGDGHSVTGEREGDEREKGNPGRGPVTMGSGAGTPEAGAGGLSEAVTSGQPPTDKALRETASREKAQGQLVPSSRVALPLWVRALDILTLATAALLLSNVLFDGFRVKLFDIDLSATSWIRSVVILAAVLGLRMWLHPGRPVWTRVAEGVAANWHTAARRAALPPFVSSRLLVLAAGYFAVILVGFTHTPPFRISRNELINLPMRWDAGWYLSVALDGYHFNPTNPGQQNIAFFPAYPVLTRLGAAFLGAYSTGTAIGPGENKVELLYHQHRRTVMSGLIISLAAFALALVYLFRFARDLLPDGPDGDAHGNERETGIAAAAVAVACAYPFSFFFSAFYTESLFLLGAIAVFYHMERQEWRPAIAWGLLVGLTRPNGCLLSVPLAFIALRHASGPLVPAGSPLVTGLAQLRGWRMPEPRRLATGLAVAAMPGIGMLLFSAYMYMLSGKPFIWLEAHHAWGRVYEGLNTLVGNHLDMIQSQGLYEYSTHSTIDMINAIAAAGALLAVWPIVRRVGLAYGLFVLLMVIPPLMAGGFLSLGRVTCTIFPIFLYLGWRCRGSLLSSVLIGGAVLQGFFAALYFTWRELF